VLLVKRLPGQLNLCSKSAYLLCTRPLAALLMRSSLYRKTIVGGARATLPHRTSSGGLAARSPDALTSRRRKS